MKRYIVVIVALIITLVMTSCNHESSDIYNDVGVQSEGKLSSVKKTLDINEYKIDYDMFEGSCSSLVGFNDENVFFSLDNSFFCYNRGQQTMFDNVEEATVIWYKEDSEIPSGFSLVKENDIWKVCFLPIQ
jgi:hypothetical protein